MSGAEPARPRVLFVDHTGELGGAELCLLDVAANAGPGSAVVLFADGPFRERLVGAGVPVEVLPAPRAVLGVRRGSSGSVVAVAAGVARLAWRLARTARRFDVVYANTQKALVVASVAGALARRPVVWHLHDLLTDEHFGRAQRRLVVLLARLFVRRVIANSEATRDAFVRAGGRAATVQVIYNGIEPAPFDAVSDDEASRVRVGLGAGRAPVVGLFGRIAPWKGHLVLLEAMAELPDVHAILVGEATFEADRDYPEVLRARAASLGLTDRVHGLGFRDDVPALMRACDVVVHASTSAEPFGRVIVEGMLAGRPVIATRAGGAVELVDDGVTGLLTPPGDADALRDAITRLLTNAPLATRLGASGRASARQRFAPADVRRLIDVAVDAAIRRAPWPPVAARQLRRDS